MVRGVLLLSGLVLVACVGGDTGQNPPPSRASTAPTRPLDSSSIPPDPVAPAPAPSPEPLPATDTAEVPPPPPVPVRPAGAARAAITVGLVDGLEHARVETPHSKPGFRVVRPGQRSLQSPWARGPNARMSQRMIWTDGARHEWALRASLALAVPTKLHFDDVELPPGAELRFGYALGARVKASEPVRATVTIVVDGKAEVRWTEERAPRPIHKLKRWSEHRVDLSDLAGKKVTLTVGAVSLGSGRGHRYTAFFGEPVLVSRAPARAPDEPPNVLLVIVDAQRADTVGPVRERRGLPEMFPAMEGLARDGTTLSKSFTVGNQTRLSTYGLLTGQYPRYARYHKVRWNYSDAEKRAFYERRPPLLAHSMRRLGYRTAAVANNLFLFGNLELCLDQGFHRVIDHRDGTKDTAWITETAESWLRAHADERWFLTINYNAPHVPYQPPKASFRAFKPTLSGVEGFSKPYLGEIKWTDEHLQRVLDLLDKLGLAKDTIVLLTADHGEVMDKRHQCWDARVRSPCLHQHGKTLFDEEIHVPMLVRWPGRIAAGKELTAPFSHIDLPPTLVSLVGGTPDPTYLGRDFAPALLGGPLPEERPIVSEARLATSVRWRHLKYILHDRADRQVFESKTLFDPRRSLEELYDHRTDPRELDNLALKGEPPELVQMRGRLARFQEELKAPRKARADVADPSPTEPEPKSPEAPPTSATPPPKESAPLVHSSLLLHPGAGAAHYTGRVVSSGRILDVEVTGGVSESTPGVQKKASELRLDLRAETKPVIIRFATDPPDAILTFELQLNGEPINASRFWVGPYGLRLYADPLRVADPRDLHLAFGPRRGPLRVPGMPAGVFFWRDGGGAESDGGVEDAGAINPEVRDLMKSWGYVGN